MAADHRLGGAGRRAAAAAAALLVAAAVLGRRSLSFYSHWAPYRFAGPAPLSECGGSSGGAPFRYCIYRAPPGTREDPDSVLYFLHFAGGSERSWGEIPLSRVYYAEFRRAGIPAPRVVSVSPGPYWNLFDRPGEKPGGGLYADFTGSWMPWLESRAGGARRRYLWGLSQGGLNGALLVMKASGTWDGAALSCPAFHAVSVYSEGAEFDAFVRRTGAHAPTARWGMALIRERVAGPSAWLAEDPVARSAGPLPSLPPLWVDANARDEFGFFEGAERFIERLRAAGREVTYKPNPGSHCAVDAVSAARFLARAAAR